MFIIKMILAALFSLTSIVTASNDPKNAKLALNTTSYDILTISMQNIECIKCPFQYKTTISSNLNATLTIDTSYPSYYFSIKNLNNKKYCLSYETTRYTFGEGGAYLLQIIPNENSTECSLTIITAPSNKYTPIIAAIFIYIGMAAIYIAGRYIKKKLFSNCYAKINDSEEIPDEPINQQPVKKTNQRLESVDALRGLCLCIMIFVNYGAGDYQFLDHALWNGLHLADLVFPCFIYIMGVSIALSFFAITSKARSFDGKTNLNVKDMIYKIFKRSLLLYFFGLLTSNDYSVTLEKLRIFGVLQRFAISYFICAMLEIVHLHSKNYVYEVQESFEQVSWRSKFKEIFLYPIQWLVMFVFTLIWVLVTFLLPVPGCPTGYLGPGGLHDNGTHENCTGGAAAYVDRIILGIDHVYQYPTCRTIYHTTIPHDPEGILGCLTSCLLTYLGVTAGHVFIHYKEPAKRVVRFVAYGFLYGGIAMLLCKASRDDGWVPINKNLWSLSFILALASISFFVMSVFYLFIDVLRWYSGAPFIFPGKNSICIYICHIVFGNYFPVRFVTPITHAARLSMDLYGVTFWCIVAAVLYYKKIFINL
jgi:heparan-alpha-glucosaminide N-acetyltransferase